MRRAGKKWTWGGGEGGTAVHGSRFRGVGGLTGTWTGDWDWDWESREPLCLSPCLSCRCRYTGKRCLLGQVRMYSSFVRCDAVRCGIDFDCLTSSSSFSTTLILSLGTFSCTHLHIHSFTYSPGDPPSITLIAFVSTS